jgi:hypothetical protein
MTNLEISKALALAIGWTENRCDENGCLDPDVAIFGHSVGHHYSEPDEVKCWDGDIWRTFDYRDPAVIWPIAERFDAFPSRWRNEGWVVGLNLGISDTPQKAVAMAVIGMR